MPADSYPAAAGQMGVWNLVGDIGSQTLFGLNGATTGVSLSLAADDPFGYDGAARDGDIRALLNDNFFSNEGDPWSVTISGLANGTYDFYYYAPSNSAVDTGPFSVNGMAALNVPGDNSVEPLIEGFNWEVLHNVIVSNGAIEVISTDSTGYRGLAGIQLLAVPEPKPIFLLGSCGLFFCFLIRKRISRLLQG